MIIPISSPKDDFGICTFSGNGPIVYRAFIWQNQIGRWWRVNVASILEFLE